MTGHARVPFWLRATLRSLAVRNPRPQKLRPRLESLDDRIVPAQALLDTGAWYWSENTQIKLGTRADEIAVGLTPGTSLDQLTGTGGALAGMTLDRWLTSTLAILKDARPDVPESAAVLNSRLATADAAPGVRFAVPVYADWVTGSWSVATNELIVALNPGVTPETALADARFSGHQRLSGSPDQYIVTVAAGYGAASWP